MGSSASRSSEDLEISKISVEYDQDSPSCSGFKSVLSGPLDEYIDFDGLWFGLVRLLKDPPKAGLLAKSECKEHSSTEFTTRHFFTVGPIGSLLGFEDFETHENTMLNYEGGDIVSERFDQSNTLLQTTCTKIHRDPLRVESWIEVPQVRDASRMVALMATDFLTRGRHVVNPEADSEGAIAVHPNEESLSGDGQKAAISDPLDDHFTDLDQIWAGWIAAAKQSPFDNKSQPSSGGLQLPSGPLPTSSVPTISKFEVKEISPSEFNVITVIDGESLDKGFDFFQRVATPVDSLLAFRSTGDRTTIAVYICDRSKAELCNQTFNHHGALAVTVWVRFYEDPLRVEVWVEQAKARRSGRVHCVMVWTFLSQIIKDFKAASAATTGELTDAL